MTEEKIREIEKMLPERFQALGTLSFDQYESIGTLYRLQGSKIYKLKVIDCGTSGERYERAMHELAIMKRLKDNPCTVPLLDYEVIDSGSEKFVCMLMPSYELADESLELGASSEFELLSFGAALCRALAQCLSNGVIYTDVKTTSIYRGDAGQLCLGDFSKALFLEESGKIRCEVETPAYTAPETYQRGECTERSLICSVGLILYVPLNGNQLPFLDSGIDEDVLKIRLQGTPVPSPKRASPMVAEYLQRLCSPDPAQRPENLYEVEKELERLKSLQTNMAPPCLVDYEEMEFFRMPTAKGERECLDDLSLKIKYGDKEIFKQGLYFARTSSEPLTVDRVEFSAVAPKTLLKGDYGILHLMMYEAAFRKEVDMILQETDVPMREAKAGMLQVQRDKTVSVILSSPDVEVLDGEDSRVWHGGYLNFSFAVQVPETYSKRQVLFRAQVYIDHVLATRLIFTAECTSPLQQKLDILREDVLSAFVSYASEDRIWVLTAVEGMKKARSDLNIFVDVENLRSGENWKKRLFAEIDRRDILYLFWSRAASHSSWVDREWRYAKETKGIEAVEPIPLEPPSICPPPKELEDKHFNESMLYIIRASKHDET